VAGVLLMAGVVAGEAAGSAGTIPKPAATRVFLAHPKVADWLDRHPPDAPFVRARLRAERGVWEIDVYADRAGQVATGTVDAADGRVLEAWTGPQVAWPLARGGDLGGPINRTLVWLTFCAVFALALGNLRHPLTVRNLDVLALLSLSAALWFFNEGRVFASASLAYPPLVYLLARCAWIGVRNLGARAPRRLPVWLLLALTVFLVAFRVELNMRSSSVIDVGYAGVVGADRLMDGRSPYGNFPVKSAGEPCSPPDSEGEIRDWRQADGRCESALPLGDTYGPVNYHAYLPGLWIFGWSGLWDDLPAVHFTSILFDLIALAGLAAVGYRFGGSRLAATLALAWAAYPFTQYVSSSNTNDSLMPALLVWGFWAASSDAARGAFAALAGWTKLASLIVLPLWATYPSVPNVRRSAVFGTAFAVVSALAFWALAVADDPLHELRVFYERTFEIQAERTSPFSLWDWGRYHAGLPDLAWLQRVLQALVVAAALACALVPRRKSPLQLAALTAALLVGFEITLTHWSAFYVAWFFPFAALALLTGTALQREAPAAGSRVALHLNGEPERQREADRGARPAHE
jgi:hypothetical protein